MTRPTKVIVDCETNISTVVELTDEEIAERDARILAAEQALIEQQAEAQRIADLKTSARNKLIAGQPLTEEEAALLVI